MNPFMMGPLAMTAWSNPDLFANAMAAQGVSPSMIGGATGANAVANPLVPQGMDQMDPLAAMMTPSIDAGGAGDGMMKLGGPTGAPGANPMAALSGMGQVVAPKADGPIMNAGVSGSQKAPELANPGGRSQLQQAVMQLLLRQQGGAPSVPGLPGLVRGV